MAVVLFDGTLPNGVKWAPLSDGAFRLGITSICWAVQSGAASPRPGFIPTGMLAHFSNSHPRRAKLAAELVDAGRCFNEPGIWVAVDQGWEIYDFDGYREAAAARARWSTAVYERDGARCRYCGATERLSVDHVVPRCQGGGDEPENLVVACKSCNSRKGGRTPQQAGMVLL